MAQQGAAPAGEESAGRAPDGGGAGDSPPESLRARLWRALAEHGQALKAKEMREACAFYDAVRKDARKCAPTVVVDVCGGHGALGMLFVAHGVAKRAVVIDQLRPTSHQGLVRAWRPFLGDAEVPVKYDERPLQTALPEALAEHGGDCLVVACHACQHLAQDIIDLCIEAKAPFAVCPCCPKDEGGRIQAAAEALGMDFGSAMVVAEMGRLAGTSDVRLRTFSSEVSPQNRVLFGTAAGACGAGAAGRAAAEARLRTAYERAQRRRVDPPLAVPTGGNSDAPEAPTSNKVGQIAPASSGGDYEGQLREKSDAVAAILRPLVDERGLDSRLLEAPGMEVRRSPAKHFRARTIVPIGDIRSESADGSGGLFRFAVDARGGVQLHTSMDAETLLVPIAQALPILADMLGEGELLAHIRPGMRSVKFHASLGGTPPQLLVCFIYGPDGEVPSAETLGRARDALGAALSAAGTPVELTVMAQARGVQRCVPEGRAWVDEQLQISGRAAPLRYRQPFGSFSNPNPHIAKATAEWLRDVICESVNTGNGGPACTDLLELYCGAGSHTVALAPIFRHVLAVEINRHLVTSCEANVAQNDLDNVTVIRAPSEEFCKRVLKRRSYQLRNDDGSTRLQLEFGCTIVDPPRAGLDALTLEAVKGYAHVLYVSCNPDALRRDLDSFLATHDLCRLVLLDHFPFSGHAEVAVHLRQRCVKAAA